MFSWLPSSVEMRHSKAKIEKSKCKNEKRMGRYVGKTSDWKKAIVTIDTNPSDKTYLGKGGKVIKVSKKYKDSIDEFMGA